MRWISADLPKLCTDMGIIEEFFSAPYSPYVVGLAMAAAKSLRASWGIILLCGAFAHPISWMVLGETPTTFHWLTLGAMAITGMSLEAYALLREPRPIDS